MRKYNFLNEVIEREFKKVGIFSKESGIPRSSLSMLISGRYQWNEAKLIKRVNIAINKLRPGLDLSRIWDVTAEYHQKHLPDVGTFKHGFKIIIDVKLDEAGGKNISSFVEGY